MEGGLYPGEGAYYRDFTVCSPYSTKQQPVDFFRGFHSKPGVQTDSKGCTLQHNFHSIFSFTERHLIINKSEYNLNTRLRV